MDAYELICIHLRHDDNGMACHVMSCRWIDIDR